MRRKGFSLLEVLVALTLIGIVFSLVFSGISGAARNLQRVDDVDRRVNLARTKLAELDLVPRLRANDSAAGEFPDGTRWTVESVNFIPPVESPSKPNPGSMIRIDLTLEWTGRNGIQKRVIHSYRYQPASTDSIPSLQEQLNALE